ncbi:MAG: hypothetical protein JWM14_1637 [Chitinophagaceae bacterium]|nr:hypothetical protein [Chitinophagaceae bacterium]
MRILFLFLFSVCLFCSKAWAQPNVHPLVWGTETGASSHARTERTTATVSAFSDTLRIPFFYDFSIQYLQLDHIKRTSTNNIEVYTLRPHGLKDNDTIVVSGAKSPLNLVFTGYKFIDTISAYGFRMYENASHSTPSTSTTNIDYLRICKKDRQESKVPDTLAFYHNGGVRINPGSAINQPSYYVARFDGLDVNGQAYSTIPLAVGYTDTLISQPFNLKTYVKSNTTHLYNSADSIYMSFNYQLGGYGEVPDAIDRLELDFLDSNNTWTNVSTINGGFGNQDSFYIAMIPIEDPKYLHKAFQYRFKSYGRQSGSYDVWNLDYILIDTGRTVTDTLIYDFAIRNGESTFLTKGYTAMPFNHFMKNPTAYVKSLISLTATNQNPAQRTRVLIASIEDKLNAVIVSGASETDTLINKVKTYTDTLKIYNFSTVANNKPFYLNLIYNFEDNQRTDINVRTKFPYDLMFNNYITKRINFYDYYAYDDYEAETAFGSNQAGTYIAMKYIAEQTDTLTHIDIAFTKSQGVDLEDSQIFLMVWKNTLTDPHPYMHPIAIHYQNYSNGLSRYQLDTTALILDSATVFYIGYKQNLSQQLSVGYDRNNESRDKTYYKESNGSWIQMSTDPAIPSGTMMMRPIFYDSTQHVPVAIHPSNNAVKNGLLLYPNPSSSTIDIIATEKVTDLQYTMYSLYGQVVASGLLTSTDHTINVSQLSTGMYLVLCTDLEGKIYSTRFIKE